MNRLEVLVDGQCYVVEWNSQIGKLSQLTVDGHEMLVTLPNWTDSLESWHWFDVNGSSFELDIDPELRWIKSIDGLHRIEVSASDPTLGRLHSKDNRIKAPIPGLITRVFVEENQSIEPGERLLILEAMKMENEICAPMKGIVRNLKIAEGKSVALGEIMLQIE